MHLLDSKRRARSLLGNLLRNTRLSNKKDQTKEIENASNAEMVEAKPISTALVTAISRLGSTISMWPVSA